MVTSAWDHRGSWGHVRVKLLGIHFPRELLSVCHRERSGLPGWVGLVILFLLAVGNTHTCKPNQKVNTAELPIT
jgi:hypothetical protein